MTKYFLYIFLAIASFFEVSAQTAKNDVVNFSAPITIYISSGQEKHAFEVERAITKAQQARGMMFREKMNKNSGMLFEFKEPKIASMWMKNTQLSLDILFIKGDGKILKIEHRAKPLTLRSASSEAEVAAVLEIMGGRAKELGISSGDTVIHNFFNTEFD